MVWRRSCVRKLSANVKMGGFRLQPLRLAAPRRLEGLSSVLMEDHTASLQPDVIKPEARYIENACEIPRMHCLALPFRWGVPAALGKGQSGLGDGHTVLRIARRRMRAPRADVLPLSAQP